MDGNTVNVITTFVFLGLYATTDGLGANDIRRRIAMDEAAIEGLTTIWNDALVKNLKLAKALWIV